MLDVRRPRLMLKLNIESNFTEHILSIGHKYTNMQTNLQVLRKMLEDLKLNALEKFKIYQHEKHIRMRFKVAKLHTMTIYYMKSSHDRIPPPFHKLHMQPTLSIPSLQ